MKNAPNERSARVYQGKLWRAAALSETEVFEWGQSGRYRPTYYLIHTLKTHLFGTNARAWFLCNFIVFFLSVVCIGMSLRSFFPSPFVILGMLLFAALPCHADLWGRLDPARSTPASGRLCLSTAWPAGACLKINYSNKKLPFLGAFLNAFIVKQEF
jgi:hypothetical protein